MIWEAENYFVIEISKSIFHIQSSTMRLINTLIPRLTKAKTKIHSLVQER